MTRHDVAQDWLDRNEKHPVRTLDGRWRWTRLRPSRRRPESMSDLPRDVFTRLPPDPTTNRPWLFETREKARFAAVLAHYAAFRHTWDATEPAPESAEYPEGDEG